MLDLRDGQIIIDPAILKEVEDEVISKGEFMDGIESLLANVDKSFPLLTKKGDMEENLATEHVEAVERLVESAQKAEIKSAELASLQHKLGAYYSYVVEDYETAVSYFNAELVFIETLPPETTESQILQIEALTFLGRAYVTWGGDHAREAFNYLEENSSLIGELSEEDYPARQEMLANNLRLIGIYYWHLGEYKEALKYCVDSRNALENSTNMELRIRAVNSIGSIQNILNKLDEAVTFHEEALALCHQPSSDCSKELETSILSNLGATYGNLGNYTAARDYFKQAVDLGKSFLPKNDLWLGTSLYNLGEAVVKSTGDTGEALSYMEQGLHIILQNHGPDHYFAIGCMDGIATVYNTGVRDSEKSLEYTKQAYASNQGRNKELTIELEKDIQRADPTFFTMPLLVKNLDEHCDSEQGYAIGVEYRQPIKVHGGFDQVLYDARVQIQNYILNNVQMLAKECSAVNVEQIEQFFEGKESWLPPAIKEIMQTNPDAVQMLIFEAINLGLMSSKERDYSCVTKFVEKHPDTVITVAQSHPEFFVDGTIVCATEQRFQAMGDTYNEVPLHLLY